MDKYNLTKQRGERSQTWYRNLGRWGLIGFVIKESIN